MEPKVYMCPKCEVSEMWDNRAKKASGQFNKKGPDFSCKDKTCGHVIWPVKSKETQTVEEYEGTPSPKLPLQTAPTPQNGTRDYTAENNAKEDAKIDWDAKDRQSMAQTAMKSASEIVAALISVHSGNSAEMAEAEAMVNKMAKAFFKQITAMKEDNT